MSTVDRHPDQDTTGDILPEADLVDAALDDLLAVPHSSSDRVAPSTDARIGRLHPPAPVAPDWHRPGVSRPPTRAAAVPRPARGGEPYRTAAWACAAGLLVFLISVPLLRRSAPVRSALVSTPAAAGTAAAPLSKPIEEIQIFDRVQGANPLLSEGERDIPEPDPATWRVLRLRMTKDGGGLLSMSLARPLAWIERVGAEAGKSIHLDLPEMGAVGDAEVLSIDACPSLKPGKGSVVTGTFAHEAGDNLITVQLSGDVEPIGVTDNHPFWSEDRRDFIPAGRLKDGEHVRTKAGTAEVIAVVRRAVKAGERVYNLEVHGEHVYQVTTAGVLVHNTCTSLINSNPGFIQHAEDAGRSVQRSLDKLTAALGKGNMNPGIGSKHLFNGIMEARARDGARVYFRSVGDRVEILAKSSKNNQDQVIDLLRQIYGR